ncbi:MAG TPA: lipid II flippase MurJ [Candidatus Limnocylindrales bacterium]|nr:lipid II flippase MurJ [Candidatus Limnocylindrales bacterium]
MTRSRTTAVRALFDRVVPQGALVLSGLSFGYFGLGILRNRVFANTFGAGGELDAYYAAFRLPEIALDVLVAAGLTAPFVPIFTSLRHDDEASANRFGRTVLTAAIGVMSAASLVLFLLAPWIGDRLEGFDGATRALYVDLLRINCLAQVLFAASFALGEILVANRRFVSYAFAPILYTGGIIVGTVLFADRYGVVATAWGAVGGAAAHLGVRVVGTWRIGFRIRPAFEVRSPAFREFVRLMLPRMVSHPVELLMLTWFTIMATGLGAGSVTSFNFASDYQVVPILLIGAPFSLAVFPTLSAAFADRDPVTFRAVLGRNLASVALLTTFAAAALFVLSGTVVQVLLGGGRFGPEDVSRTTGVVAAFALSIPFDALAYPLSRGLYATHDTVRQAASSFVALGVVVVASSVLVGPLGIVAIPLAYTAGMVAKDLLLGIFLARRVRGLRAAGISPVS